MPPVRWPWATGGPVRAFLESALGTAEHKAAAFGERAAATAELVSAQKLAVVAASAATLAGGVKAVDQFAHHQGPSQPTPPSEQVEAKPVKEEVPIQPAPAPPPPERPPGQTISEPARPRPPRPSRSRHPHHRRTRPAS
jgi:hypothetical protein